MFKLERQCTAHGIKLAQKLWDFLTINVEKRFDTRWQDRQLATWATTFDTFLKDHDYERVCDVFNFYVKEWDTRRGYVHLTPDSFIGDFTLLEQRFEWNSRPISEEELKPFLRPLAIERWDCDWDMLVTAVSKSVYNLRTFLHCLAKSKLPSEVKRRIRSIYGSIQEYIVNHFLRWRKHQIEAVWVATITTDIIFNEVRRCLSKLGYPNRDCSRMIEYLRKAVKDGDYADSRN